MIPCVAERMPPRPLGNLLRQAERHPNVEILWLGDNRRCTVGAKRQRLLDIAQGVYVAQVDDDDNVAGDYLDQIVPMLASSLDVVTFDVEVVYDAGLSSCICECKIGNENCQAAAGKTVKRAAWHVHAWRTSLARQSRFPDVTGLEDWPWAEPLQALVQRHYRIPEVLYHYSERDGPSPYA